MYAYMQTLLSPHIVNSLSPMDVYMYILYPFLFGYNKERGRIREQGWVTKKCPNINMKKINAYSQ